MEGERWPGHPRFMTDRRHLWHIWRSEGTLCHERFKLMHLTTIYRVGQSCQKDWWWLSRSRVPMLNFVWTNHVCKRLLLFHCVSSENSLKYALRVIVSVISAIVNIYAN